MTSNDMIIRGGLLLSVTALIGIFSGGLLDLSDETEESTFKDLASDLSDYVTGQVISVCGGMNT